jgi:hypothetical protein
MRLAGPDLFEGLRAPGQVRHGPRIASESFGCGAARGAALEGAPCAMAPPDRGRSICLMRALALLRAMPRIQRCLTKRCNCRALTRRKQW